MLRVLLIVVLVGLVVGIAAAQGGYFWDGNDYRARLSSSEQRAYIAGIIDAFAYHNAMAGAVSGGPAALLVRCLQTQYPNLTLGQAHAILDRYMREHPELWGQPMAGTVVFALCDRR